MSIHHEQPSPQSDDRSLSQESLPSVNIPGLDERTKTVILPLNTNTPGLTFHPEGVDHGGKHFEPKAELHVTAIGFKTAGLLKKAFKKDETLEAQVNELIARTDWTMTIRDEQLHLSKPQTVSVKGGGEEIKERESIIQLVDAPGLEDFYKELNSLLGTDIEAPPPHVTLYTYNDSMGIGINTHQDLEQATQGSVQV